MDCKLCGKSVNCEIHGDNNMSEFEHSDGSYYYSCGDCVEDCGAFGSITHHCGKNKMFDMSRNAPEKQVILVKASKEMIK